MAVFVNWASPMKLHYIFSQSFFPHWRRLQENYINWASVYEKAAELSEKARNVFIYILLHSNKALKYLSAWQNIS